MIPNNWSGTTQLRGEVCTTEKTGVF